MKVSVIDVLLALIALSFTMLLGCNISSWTCAVAGGVMAFALMKLLYYIITWLNENA